MVLEKQTFFENKLSMLPWQLIKLRNYDKSLMKCGELFNKHFCKNKILLSPIEISKYAKFQLHPPNTVSEKKKFEYFFFENLPFMSSRQPIKSSNLDKNRMKHGGLLNKHFYKKKNQISPMTCQKLSISTFPIISP